jgi:hypothetical protein
MRRIMQLGSVVLGIGLILAGMSGVASALTSVPEIDPASGMNALVLASGLLLAARGYRRK